MLGNDLAYVALAASDPDGTARVLAEVLGLARRDLHDGAGATVPVLAVGASALALFPLGSPGIDGASRPGVHHIAIAVPDLDVGLAAAARAGMLPTEGARPTAGLAGRPCVRLDPATTAAVRTCLTTPLGLAPARGPTIERLDHIGVASDDNRAAVATWTGRLGRPLESEQVDMEVAIAVESFTSTRHGVVYHTRPPVPVAGLRVAFITLGDTELEYLESFDPRQPGSIDHGSAGTTRQDQGAIARFVARQGAGLHHIAFKVADIDAVLTRLARAGAPLIDQKGRPGSRASRIGFMHPKGTGGVLMHFVERPGA